MSLELGDALHGQRSPVGGLTYFAGACPHGGAEALERVVAVRSQPVVDALGNVAGAVRSLQLVPHFHSQHPFGFDRRPEIQHEGTPPPASHIPRICKSGAAPGGCYRLYTG